MTGFGFRRNHFETEFPDCASHVRRARKTRLGLCPAASTPISEKCAAPARRAIFTRFVQHTGSLRSGTDAFSTASDNRPTIGGAIAGPGSPEQRMNVIRTSAYALMIGFGFRRNHFETEFPDCAQRIKNARKTRLTPRLIASGI
jgi:hypothetical protein